MPITSTAPRRSSTQSPVRIVIVGHVDHGKSSLIGRLFYDTNSLPDGKFESVRRACDARGVRFEWAFLLDALMAERDQGITIDTTQMWFKTELRDYVIIDAPGHREFIKNMITGAASADAALLVVDADEGMQEQTRTHGYLLHLFGVRQIAVVVNKMDKVGFSEARFQEVAASVTSYLWSLGLDSEHVPVIPICAREGDNIASPSTSMPWYTGSTVVDALDSFPRPVGGEDLPLRLPVQDVYKFDDRRIIAGRLQSGHLRTGDTILFSPSNKQARVNSIEGWNADGPIIAARAGQSIGITLDQQIFVERGEVISHSANPPMLSKVFRGRLFWFGSEPMTVGRHYKMKINTAEHMVTVEAIERVINVADLSGSDADKVERNEIAEVVLRSRALMSLDDFSEDPRAGRFVLVDNFDTVGGGLVSTDGYADARSSVAIKSTNITRVAHRVSLEQRWVSNGHKSGIIWLTGLSGSGKSTLGFALEQFLHAKGYQVFVLDGDNVRHGLCADLGFSPEDRAENIRRVGEMAHVFANAGVLVITAFISPYRSDRRRVREIAGNLFHEIHVKADLATCEQRDPKGLYRRARQGEIENFTGVSAPYEEPLQPELLVDTTNHQPEESLQALIGYVEANFGARSLGDLLSARESLRAAS